MKNINKLVQNTDLSLKAQVSLYSSIENVSIEIDLNKERYEKCKKRFLAANAERNEAIAVDDYAAQLEAAQEIIPIVKELHETRERIKLLTSNRQGLYKKQMDHQKSDKCNQKSDEHVYVLPRQHVIEFLEALEERADANPDFKTITLAIDKSFLKK